MMTVGKTHSGKATFGQALAGRLGNACVIDQDNHAAFVNTYYQALLPKHGPNLLKYSISETVTDYAITQTDVHISLCNAYRSRAGRTKLFGTFRAHGFTTVLVNFDLPDEVLPLESPPLESPPQHAAPTFSGAPRASPRSSPGRGPKAERATSFRPRLVKRILYSSSRAAKKFRRSSTKSSS